MIAPEVIYRVNSYQGHNNHWPMYAGRVCLEGQWYPALIEGRTLEEALQTPSIVALRDGYTMPSSVHIVGREP